MKSFTLYSDDSLSQVYESTKISRKGEIFDDIAKKKQTIKFSVGLGHESVLEHTNLIMGFKLDAFDFNTDLMDVLETCHYLHWRLYNTNTDNEKFLIIAGSIRGYKHIFRNIKDMNNKFLEVIKQELYENSYSDFFNDFIEDGIMDAKKFNPYIGHFYPVVTLPNGETAAVQNSNRKDELTIKDRVSVLWYDDILKISDKILTATGMTIPFVDLLDFCTIGVKIWCSRTASHQIVRHRNGVTQESQRYCNYAEIIKSAETMVDKLHAMFVDPCLEDLTAACGGPIKYKTVDKNSPNYLELYKKYIDNDSHRYLELAAKNALESYQYIVDKKELLPEDVRAILPGNTKTSLIMTFTYRNLIKAIELRVAKGAQSEIRNIFICLEDLLKNHILYTNTDLNDYICPCGKNNYYSNIKEMVGDADEREISEEESTPRVSVEELSTSEKEELKNDLNNDYGTDISKLMETAPKDIFTEKQ